MRNVLALFLTFFLAACTTLDEPGPKEVYPPLVVAVLDPFAEPGGRLVALVSSRKGYLHNRPEALAAVAGIIQPLDIVAVSSKQRLSSHVIPGHFMHVAVYLGLASQLRAEGYDLRPLSRTRAISDKTPIFIESDSKGVGLSRIQTVLDTDAVVVLRPKLSKAERQSAKTLLLEHLGTKFDFHMNADDDRHLFCSELVDHVMPSLQLRKRRYYARTVIFPTDVASQALSGSRLSLVSYIRADNNGWQRASAGQLRKDIENGW